MKFRHTFLILRALTFAVLLCTGTATALVVGNNAQEDRSQQLAGAEQGPQIAQTVTIVTTSARTINL